MCTRKPQYCEWMTAEPRQAPVEEMAVLNAGRREHGLPPIANVPPGFPPMTTQVINLAGAPRGSRSRDSGSWTRPSSCVARRSVRRVRTWRPESGRCTLCGCEYECQAEVRGRVVPRQATAMGEGDDMTQADRTGPATVSRPCWPPRNRLSPHIPTLQLSRIEGRCGRRLAASTGSKSGGGLRAVSGRANRGTTASCSP